MEIQNAFGRLSSWEAAPLRSSSLSFTEKTPQESDAATADAEANEVPSPHGRNSENDLVILADANSFFASCERVFDPSLADKPVVVLSNNDGCIVARSAQAKRMVPEGVPWFQVKEQARQHGIIARSSNYELYGSLSQRMMHVMNTYFQHQEVYSIDECFLHSRKPLPEVIPLCKEMRSAVLQGVGVPVSVGIAPTKTLAKITNHWAKKRDLYDGVCAWEDFDEKEQDRLLAHIPIDEVWGVGRRLTKKLLAMGIVTAKDLRDADPTVIRRRFSVLLQRTVLELRGIPCIDDDSNALNGFRKQQILCSRMFSTPLTGVDKIQQALSVYLQNACRRLRRQGCLASTVGIFCSVSPYSRRLGEFSLPLTSTHLETPTDNPLILMKAIRTHLLEGINPTTRYIRAGVILSDLKKSDSYHTLEGFEAQRDEKHIGRILDTATARFGQYSLGIGYGGIRGTGRRDHETGAEWSMRREMLSPRCTTRWDEMAVVKA